MPPKELRGSRMTIIPFDQDAFYLRRAYFIIIEQKRKIPADEVVRGYITAWMGLS